LVIHIFVPLTNVVVPVAAGGRPDALQVCPRIGFGERDRGPSRTGRQLGQVALLLVGGPVRSDHPAGQRMRAEDAGDAHPAAGQLLEDECERDRAEIQPAVLGRHGNAKQAHPLEALDDLGGVALGVLPVSRDWDDLLVDEVAEHSAKLAFFLVEVEVHRLLPWLGLCGCRPEHGQRTTVGQLAPAQRYRIADAHVVRV
jgi:hypothetical protein